MDKIKILEKYKKTEDKLLISKFLDKVEALHKTNKIVITDFFNEMEQNIIKKVINIIGLENYDFFGGIVEADRKIVILYPDKMRELFENKNFKYDTVLSVIKIENSQNADNIYSHRVYLGGIIKLGLRREKVGDIIVNKSGAEIIVKKEIESFLYTNLNSLTRFKEAKIKCISLSEIMKIEKKFDEIKIISSSFRLDNIVSELAKTSRNKANEIIEQERVIVNYVIETKNTKQVCEGNVITIRGKGKFIIEEIMGNTKKGNYIIRAKKYV